MFHQLQGLVPPPQATTWAQALEALPVTAWDAGRLSAGEQAAAVKHNLQLPREHELAQTVSRGVLAALNTHAGFLSAALPRRVFPPRLNRYDIDHPSFDWHVDGAIRLLPPQGEPMRTDLSCTVFLNPPEAYDGGVLEIQDGDTVHRLKGQAGDAVLYPAHTLHRVTPVTQGTRLACFFWVESLLPNDGERRLLHSLDRHLCALREAHGESAATTGLTQVYHQLLRQWSHT